MAWFKVDDGLHSSRKLMSIPKRARFAAAGVWTIAGSWSADELTDGRIPEYMLRQWGVPPSAPVALVDAGLWERTQDGYAFCNWAEYQPSKHDVDAERAVSRARMRELRARRKQGKPQDSAGSEDMLGRTVANGSGNVSNPDPTRPDPTPSPKGEGRPSPFCLKHPDGSDAPCHGCGNARRRLDAFDAAEKTKPTLTPARAAECGQHPGYPLPCHRCEEDAMRDPEYDRETDFGYEPDREL